MKSIEERLVKVEVDEPVIVPNTDGTTRTIMVKVPALRDPEDGEIYLGADAIALLDKAKARHMGVLAPQELAELRKRLDLTQSEIAELFTTTDNRTDELRLLGNGVVPATAHVAFTTLFSRLNA